MSQNKKRVPFLIEERYDLGRLVTFTPNKRIPIHNWYYFKEGFSRDFVFMMFDWFKIKKDDCVLDPFCGAGTSLLTSKELGINAVGIDASPLSVFISQVKTANYDLEKLKNTSKEILSKKFKRVKGVEPSSLVKKAFTKGSLEELFFLKEEIRNLTNPQIKNFFTLALINSANLSSYAYKDGGVIKIIKKPVPPLNKMFRRVLKKMIHDVKKTKYSESKIRIHHGDARNMNFLQEEYFDFVITSPPYLNNIKYTKIYSIEYELFCENVKIDSLR